MKFRACILLALALLATPARAAAPVAAKVTIDASQVVGKISPLLYGQFLEYMFEGIKGGLHAELIKDRSFDEASNVIGLPRNWERYPDDRNDDYGLTFTHDNTVFYPERKTPEHSLCVEAGGGVVPRRGIYQGRMPIREGVEYRGYLWLKTSNYVGPVVVSLEPDVLGGPAYAEARIETIVGHWKRYEFHLNPSRADPLARLAILFPGRGKVWIDQVSLIPGDAIDGVRRDVLDRVEALRPAFIRWPGGNVAQDYHWRWGIGPRDERPTWKNLSWKNERENGDFGTPEFLAFCRRVHAEPQITVNVDGRGATVEDAAAWVEYCNAPTTTKHGAIRAADGHPEPYGVKYWEVGNEIWGSWVRGHSNAATYARNFNRYATAMRAVDPTIKLIAVGDNDLNWNREVLRSAGQGIDFLAIHHYYSRRDMAGDRLNLMAHPLHYGQFYGQLKAMIAELVPGRSIALAINEWGLDLPTDQQYSIDAGLYAARLMNVFERTDGLVGMSAVSDLVNGWPGGIIQASRHGVFVTPIYLVNRLYAEHLGSDRLVVEVSGPTFDSSREGRGVAHLDAVASRSADGKHIYLKAVNTDPTHPLNTTLIISGATPAKRGRIATVRASAPDAVNGFATPDAVAIVRTDLATDQTFTVELPPASVSVITLDLTP